MNKKERLWQAMNPEMRDVVKRWEAINQALYKAMREGKLPKERYARSRAGYRFQLAPWNEGGPVPAEVAETVLEGPHGLLRLRLYRPAAAAGAPLFYIHGGGYIVGDLDTHDRLMRELAAVTSRAVVGIDYHLAPMATYPVPLEEVLFAIAERARWAAPWGLPAERLVLAGDSAGATIALAANFRYARAETAAPIAANLLFYGDYGMLDSFSRRRLGGPWDGMTRGATERWERLYLPEGRDPANPDHHLAEQPIGKTFPRTFVAVSDLDPLLDDNRLLAAKLEDVGRGGFYLARGVLHTYLQMAELTETQRTLAAAAAFLAKEEDHGLFDRD